MFFVNRADDDTTTLHGLIIHKGDHANNELKWNEK
jgi:hypothetical protein